MWKAKAPGTPMATPEASGILEQRQPQSFKVSADSTTEVSLASALWECSVQRFYPVINGDFRTGLQVMQAADVCRQNALGLSFA